MINVITTSKVELTHFLHHGILKEILLFILHVFGKHPIRINFRICYHKKPSQQVIHALRIANVWTCGNRMGGEGLNMYSYM